MKKGKTSKIQNYDFAKITFGTVDSVNLKSIYLNIQTWAEPKIDSDNWNRIVLNLNRSIKHSIYDSIDKEMFTENFISDLDLRSSGISTGKKSFMNLEINLYLLENIGDFKSRELKDSLKKIVSKIFNDNFYKNKHFTFHLTKKSKNTVDVNKY